MAFGGVLVASLVAGGVLASSPTGEYCGSVDGVSKISLNVYTEALVAVSDCGDVGYAFEAGSFELDDPRCGSFEYDAARNAFRASSSGAVLTQEGCFSSAAWNLDEGGGGGGALGDSKMIALPALNIDPRGVVTSGCSHAGDFAEQFHVAFSSLVSGACVFSGQPYHCAVHHFRRDYEVPQTDSTGVPNCEGCSTNMTLLYDHCKNHPQWVDVGELVDYPRRTCGFYPVTDEPCVDDPKHLYDARVFLFHPTKDRCYLPGAIANSVDFYGMMLTDPKKQVKFVDSLPFPHTLPHNSTPYFNHSEPAGYDGPGECLRHVFAEDFGFGMTWAAAASKPEHKYKFNQTDFSDFYGAGVGETGEIYIPEACMAKTKPCKLVLMVGGVDDDFAKYAETNDIVIVGFHVGGYVDEDLFPNAGEVLRGLSDVYGQLSADYATQNGYQMRAAGRILRRVMGLE